MNDNRSHNRFSSDDSSDFEQRLREFQPTPPRSSWEDLESSMSFDRQVVAPKPHFSAWAKMVTHAAAALVGVALGVVLMLVWKADSAADTNNISGVAERLLDTPADSKGVKASNRKVADGIEPASFSVTSRRNFGPIGSGILTPLDRNIELRDWRNVSYDRLSSNVEPVSSTSSDVCKPMTAPQLLRELLDEQSEVSGGSGNTTNSG